jgi:hypothetical protein
MTEDNDMDDGVGKIGGEGRMETEHTACFRAAFSSLCRLCTDPVPPPAVDICNNGRPSSAVNTSAFVHLSHPFQQFSSDIERARDRALMEQGFIPSANLTPTHPPTSHARGSVKCGNDNNVASVPYNGGIFSEAG